MKKNKYDMDELLNDFTNVSKELIAKAKNNDITIEEDPQRLNHMIKNDLRDNMPSQIYALIGLVTSAVEKLERESKK